MKTLIILSSLIILNSCGKHTSDESHNYVFPEGLKDCKLYEMEGDGIKPLIRVMRCPHSDTTTTHPHGKSTISTTVVDG